MAATYEGGLFTPDTVLAEMKSVDRAIDGMTKDLLKFQVPDEVAAGFKQFRDDWKEYYEANRGFFDRSFNTTYQKTLEFKAQANDWRQILQSSGLRVTTPAIPAEVKPRRNWIKTGLWVAGGAFAIWWVVKNRNQRVVVFEAE